MEVNKVSEPIAITDRKTYETVYYVVKVTKKDAKKESWKDYEAILKDYIINKKAYDVIKKSIIFMCLIPFLDISNSSIEITYLG